MRVLLILKPNDRGVVGDGSLVDRSGIVTPAGTYLVARSEDLITLFVPGSHHFSGRGTQRYSGADYEIYRVEPGQQLGDRRVWTNLVMSWPVRRPKP